MTTVGTATMGTRRLIPCPYPDTKSQQSKALQSCLQLGQLRFSQRGQRKPNLTTVHSDHLHGGLDRNRVRRKPQHIAAQWEKLMVQFLSLRDITGFERCDHRLTSFGTMFPATETTPLAPSAINGSVRLSSPESSVRSEADRICEA